MNFEWNPEKNESNIGRHSIDFSDAWEIFASPLLFEPDDRFDYGEVRFFGIGLLRGITVVLIFTEPNDDTIRIISLRRATNNERQKYHKFLEDRLGSVENDV